MRSAPFALGVFLTLGVSGCTSSDETPPTQPVEDSSTPDTQVADTKADLAVVSDASPDVPTPDAPADTNAQDAGDATVADTTDARDAAVADTTVADTTVADTTIADTTVADTTVADATVADTADVVVSDATVVDQGAETSSTANCGNAPYQLYDPLMANIVVDTPKTTVTITGNICPNTTVDIPYKESRTMNVPRNTPMFFIATQTGSLTNLSREFNVTIGAFAKLPYQAMTLPPTFPMGIDPAWDPATKALLYVVVNASTGAGACNAKDGVTYSVPNHPEAVIKYSGGGTSTAAGGDANAWISLVTTGTVAAPEYVTIVQTKTGCKVDLNGADKLFVSGRAPIAINAVTAALSGEVMNP